jgi:biopolymer transport protein ExbD
VKLRRSVRPVGGPVDLAPLAGVLLLLVLYFAFSASFVVQPGVPVTLHDRLLGPGTAATRKVVSVTAAGEIYIEQQATDLAGLRAQLEAFARSGADPVVILKADEGVAHGRVLSVMNEILGARLSVVLAARAFDAGAAMAP